MKTSRRARRIQRHYGRMHRAGGLNLVSLMDIFTILVFFLMVNSSDVKVMKSTVDMPLPVSDVQTEAVETLLVQVTEEAILVQGREVARLVELQNEDATVSGLSRELGHLRTRRGEVPEAGFEITVMAGRETPYRLLRKVMKTCIDQDYRRVRLAVEAREKEPGNG